MPLVRSDGGGDDKKDYADKKRGKSPTFKDPPEDDEPPDDDDDPDYNEDPWWEEGEKEEKTSGTKHSTDAEAESSDAALEKD